MSRAQRFGFLAVAIAIAVVAFLLVGPGSDEEDSGRSPVRTETAPGTGPSGATDREPPVTRIAVRGGQPVGGVQTVEATRGETVRLSVRSPDTSEEVHVHGYDFREELRPGRPASFGFRADLEGVFEVELEGSHVTIARLVVEPS